MGSSRFALCALLVTGPLLLTPACRSIARYASASPDASQDLGSDAPRPDAPRPDAPHPDAPRPDAPRHDAPTLDVPVVDLGTPTEEIGKPCSHAGECSSQLCVVPAGQSVGVCAIPCQPDDLNTPLVNDDTCPDLSINICAADPSGSGAHYCYRRCAPKLGSSDCAAGIACQPASATLAAVSNTVAVCLYVGCTSDDDCPVVTEKNCGTATCVQCIAGRCAVAGQCDLASGLCAPRTATGTFTSGAAIGDPCKADTDCDAAMRCEREVVRPGAADGKACGGDGDCCSGVCEGGSCIGACRVHARNGYCTMAGCAFASLASCPIGAVCSLDYPAGWCLKGCQLGDPKACRDVGADKLGDYECRAWNNVSLAGNPVTSVPVCDFGDALPCDRLDCTGVANDKANATNMACRNLANEKLADPRDARGLCLDNTASGSPP